MATDTELATTGISDALVVLGAAGLVIPAFARVRVSPVIGFILVGIAVGPFGLGHWVGRAPWLSWLVISDPAGMKPVAEIGIVLLLFTIGLHLSFRRLWSMRAQVFGTGAAELGVTAAVLAFGLALLGQPIAGAVAIGLALALSSTALVLPITGTTGALGRASFAVLLFEDLALVPIVFLLGALSPHASGGAGAVALVALVGGATVVAMYGGGRLCLPILFAQAARTRSPELFLAASLLVAIAASLVTAAAGLSPIVGALLAGLLIAETPYHDEVEAIVRPFQGLALGVFLITVGMELDLHLLSERWPLVLLALATVVGIKAGLMAVLLRAAGTRWGIAAEGGLLMGSPGETSLIVLGVAAEGALLAPADAAFWQAVTALGLTVTPLLAWAGQATRRRMEASLPLPEVEEEGSVTVIVGFGRVGRVVGELLTAHGRRWLAIDADVDGVASARAEGLPVRFGDAARGELFDRLRLDRADALVLTMNDPALSTRLAEAVRERAPALVVIARARDAGHAARLYRAGVTEAVPETLESSLQLAEAVLVEGGAAMGPVIASIHERRAGQRQAIRDAAALDREPRLRRLRRRG